jgi:predicted ester cyclase
MADAREVAARFVDAFNAHDEQAIRALNAENGVVEAPGELHVEGRDAATAYAMGWLEAFPDATMTVHTELVDGDWVAQRFTFAGTHEGPLPSPTGTVPPTHRRLAGRGVQMIRVENDAVVETPFGTDLELISYPHGMAYERTAAVPLWNPRDNHP